MYIYQIMSNNFGYLDIILLGMIAGFIILRLRSILGRKTGHESKVYPSFAEKKFSMPQKDNKTAEQNLGILEGKDKKEFLKEEKTFPNSSLFTIPLKIVSFLSLKSLNCLSLSASLTLKLITCLAV